MQNVYFSAGSAEWTDYLEWQVQYQNGDMLFRNSRRYCYIQFGLTCVYEEQLRGDCCLQPGQCGEKTMQEC